MESAVNTMQNIPDKPVARTWHLVRTWPQMLDEENKIMTVKKERVVTKRSRKASGREPICIDAKGRDMLFYLGEHVDSGKFLLLEEPVPAEKVALLMRMTTTALRALDEDDAETAILAFREWKEELACDEYPSDGHIFCNIGFLFAVTDIC